MSKRFTDSEKWKKPFIRSLDTPYKLLWLYILDNCDHAGIWDVEIDVAKLRLNEDINKEKAAEVFKNKIVIFDNGKKWFIPSFIEFQYGELSSDNRVHKSIIIILKRYNLFKPLKRPLQGCKDKDKDKDKAKDKDKDRWFDEIYEQYPRKDGKKEAKIHFDATINTDDDLKGIRGALINYLNHIKVNDVKSKFIKMASTWFNNWEDWIDYKEPLGNKQGQVKTEEDFRKAYEKM